MTSIRKKLDANRIAMLATHDNPVSVMALGKVHAFAQSCIKQGATEQDAVDATRKFIQQLNGNSVG